MADDTLEELRRERKRASARKHYWANKAKRNAATMRCRAAAALIPADERERLKAEKVANAPAAKAAALAARKAWKKAWAAKWRKEKPKAASEAFTAWRLANPEKARMTRRRRNARKKGAEGSHTADDVLDILNAQGKKCAYSFCRSSLKAGYHVDHIMPLALGGSNDRRNLQILCPTCNWRKHSKHPLVFAQENGLLV